MEQTDKKKEIIEKVVVIGIAAVLLILWFAVLDPLLFPRVEVEESETANENMENIESDEQDSSSDTSQSYTEGDANARKGDYTLYPLNTTNTNDIRIYETDKYIIYFNTKGGVVQDIRYKDFVKEEKEDSIIYESGVYAESIKEFPDNDDFAERLLRGASINFVTGEKIYNEPYAKYEYEKDKSENEVILSTIFIDKDDNQVKIEKKFKFKEKEDGSGTHDFDLKITFKNLSNNDIVIRDNDDVSFYLHWGGGIGPYAQPSAYDRWEPFIARKSGGKIEISRSVNDFKNMDMDRNGIIPNLSPAWIGGGNRYFLISLIPEYSNTNRIKIEHTVYNTDEESLKNQTDFFGLGFSGFILKAGESRTTSVTIYAGPKRYSDLEQFGIKMEISAEHGGIIEFLVRLIEWLLLSINSVINNFGLSIIIITILLRLVLYPLQAKSLKSMSRMKDLQPKMDEIKKRFKEKSEQYNKAIMDLYKKEKINPLGGCLPMLFQFPFFIAFFNVMPYLVDLKGKAFLWAMDLASPDTIATLPFFPNQINLFPLLMAGVMVGNALLQQQITPTTNAMSGGKNNMKIFNYALPAIFLLITYYAPSGLTIYWTFSTLLGIGQQLIFNFIKGKKKSEDKVVILNSKGRPVK